MLRHLDARIEHVRNQDEERDAEWEIQYCRSERSSYDSRAADHESRITVNRITAHDPEAHSADVVAGNLRHLKAVFPEAFVEGKVDFAVLKQLLGNGVDEREERYGLDWHGLPLCKGSGRR